MTRTRCCRFRGLAVAGAATAATMLAIGGPAGLASAAGSRQPATATAAGSAAKIGLRSTSLGKILVNASGHTLYAFTKDSRNKDRCVSTEGCTATWPLVTTNGAPTAGRGVKASLLSSIKVAGGKHQVTYDGHPLYTYAFDRGPGGTGYVGVSEFGGTWRALTASGSLTG